MIYKIWGAVALFILFSLCCNANDANLTKIGPLEFIEKKLTTSGEIDKETFRELDSLIRAYSGNPFIAHYLNVYDTFLSDHSGYKQYRAGYFYSKAFVEYANYNMGSAYYYGKLAYNAAASYGKIKTFIAAAYMLICIEYQNNNYGSCIRYYKQVEPLLSFFIRKVDKCPDNYACLLPRMCGILTSAGLAYIAQNDLVKAKEILALNDILVRIADKSLDPENKNYLSARYQTWMGKYNYACKMQGNAEPYLDSMLYIVQKPGYSITEKNNDLVNIYHYYVRSAFAVNDFSKMAHYLQCMKDVEITRFIAFKLQRDIIFYDGMSYVYKWNKNYYLSTLARERVSTLQDSLNNLLMKVQFNNLYAKADAEFHKNELILETNKKKAYRKYLNMTVSFGSLILTGGLLIIFYIKYRQRTDIIISRLAIARDIHDEIGPMLLYAKIMTGVAKSDGNKHPIDMANLDEQLGATLEKVRSLAKKIKSGIDESVSFHLFSEQLVAILEKNRKISGIGYDIDIEEGYVQSISSEVSMQLKTVLGELVCNSLKHAMCTLIRVKVSIIGNQMTIFYSDNGRGFNSEALYHTDGQGLANIKERIKILNGTTIFKNHFPTGYAIELIVPI